MKKSVYRNQNKDLRDLFASVNSYKKILCVAIDFAKAKHVALICDGHGTILKKPFVVYNSTDGVDFLEEQILSSARRRKIPRTQIFIGGEDLPCYTENFLNSLASRGFLIVRVNALEAKKVRENMAASNDQLDLLGISKTLLNKRAVTIAKPGFSSDERNEIYRTIRELSRSRARTVKFTTAISNQIHTYVDRLFPGFLDSSRSGIAPFSTASLELMKDEFSSIKIARKKVPAFSKKLRRWKTRNPEESAFKLIESANNALPPNPEMMAVQQRVLKPLVEQYENLTKTSEALKIEAAIYLASTPYAFLTSIPGIALAISSGMAGELGNPKHLPAVKSICAYGGIIPWQNQTGGPDHQPKQKGTVIRCNRTFKHWLMQATEKANQYGNQSWKERVNQRGDNDQHVTFLSARNLLRVSKVLVSRHTTYQCDASLEKGATAEIRAADAEQTLQRLITKWKVVPGWQQVVFGHDKPLGLWRQVMIDLYDADLPLQ